MGRNSKEYSKEKPMEDPSEYTSFKPYEAETQILVNLRELPSKDSKSKMVIGKGHHLTVFEESNGWGNTKYGWVKLEFTKKV